MTATMSFRQSLDRDVEFDIASSESTRRRSTFSVEIEHLGDASRLARCASALANPTTVALVSASVDNVVVYPASPESVTRGSVVQLTFATRDHQQTVDAVSVERIVSALGGHGVVLAVQQH
jgi:hypothetical protein